MEELLQKMSRKEINASNFLHKVREYVPEFRSVEKEEAVDNDTGEHYIMGALKRFAKNLVKKKNEAVLKKISIFLDECWSNGEYEVHNAVMVSFFEDFPDRSFKVIKPYLSSILMEESEHYRNQWKKWTKNRALKGHLHDKYNHYFNEEESRKIDEELKKLREKIKKNKL